jgi:uncharacterized protein YkwD
MIKLRTVFLVFSFSLGFVFNCFAQQPETVKLLLKKWDLNQVEQAKALSDVGYFSQEEKNVLFYLNLLRINPRKFHDTFFLYFKDSLGAEEKFIRSAAADLLKAVPLQPVKPHLLLFDEARKHATQMGASGKTGHKDVYGTPYVQRVHHLTKKFIKVQENCQYGYSQGLFIIMDLLIDNEINDLSHRKSLLNENIRYAGISIQKHRTFKVNTVIEFGFELKK